MQQPPALAEVAEALRRLGRTPADCVAMARSVSDSSPSQAQVFALKKELQTAGTPLAGDELERVILTCAVQESMPRIASLAVYDQVKNLMQKEMQSYFKPPGVRPHLLAGTDPFVTACKIATLRRFVAGPVDWVISGVPRSWLLKMPWSRTPQAVHYIATQFRGLKPAFYLHVAPEPRNRSLVIPKEVQKAYYRMARSLELQPQMKGILCASWFHDQSLLKEMPHLAPLNAPYLEHGGRIIATLGPAPPDSGFLDHNPDRRKLYEAGRFRPLITLAMWPRAAAIRWAQAHPELEK